ncbi:MAG TPA: NAD-dependent epimerase/dehydratase family protein [Chitinophagaceae bacterium]|nr:NAD-dependent epimerase/dehydratase family protein [Chitinophagaceae bacterium]
MNNQPNETINVILTGATGMVGEGVLHECLQHGAVKQVLIINRKPSGITHPKLKEIIHTNFYNLAPIENQLSGFNTCFFCLGVSSVGMKKAQYYRLTHTLTMQVAESISRLNTGMTFCYISGAGTDSTEKGRSMWASVKGKTENDLMKLAFKKVYNFRPGVLQPTKGLKNTLSFYRWFGWLLPIIKLLAPKYITSLHQLGTAMINAATKGYEKQILEIRDIQALSKA